MDIFFVKYKIYKNLYKSIKAGSRFHRDTDQYMMDYLDDRDSVSFSKIDKLRKKETKSYVKKRERNRFLNKERIISFLETYQYQPFSHYLSAYVRVSKELGIDYSTFLNNLIYILFNKLDGKIPSIWITQEGGYYDIRYLFDIVFYGGRIAFDNITRDHSKIIWEYFYEKIIENIKHNKYETIETLIRVYPYVTSFSILSPDFTPYPKNEYNKNFVNVLDN